MTTTIIIDKAGRVVIPKPMRKELHLGPGDSLELESSGEQIVLRPVKHTVPLCKERGVWVYRSGRMAKSGAISDLVDQTREERSRDLMR